MSEINDGFVDWCILVSFIRTLIALSSPFCTKWWWALVMRRSRVWPQYISIALCFAVHRIISIGVGVNEMYRVCIHFHIQTHTHTHHYEYTKKSKYPEKKTQWKWKMVLSFHSEHNILSVQDKLRMKFRWRHFFYIYIYFFLCPINKLENHTKTNEKKSFVHFYLWN